MIEGPHSGYLTQQVDLAEAALLPLRSLAAAEEIKALRELSDRLLARSEVIKKLIPES